MHVIPSYSGGPHYTGFGTARPVETGGPRRPHGLHRDVVDLRRGHGAYSRRNPDSGHTSAHPCVAIAHSAGQQLLRYSSELGLSPVAERKLGSITPDDDEHSPFSGG